MCDLGVDTFCHSVDLKASFSHLCITQEVEWHPNQMTLWQVSVSDSERQWSTMGYSYLDVVKTLSHMLSRGELIEQVSSLAITSREEVLIILKCLDVVIRIGVEEPSKHLGVGRSTSCPHLPQLVGHGISDECIPLITFVPRVLDARWLSVGVILCIKRLGRKQTKVLTPQESAEGSGVVTSFVVLAVHFRREQVGILHND